MTAIRGRLDGTELQGTAPPPGDMDPQIAAAVQGLMRSVSSSTTTAAMEPQARLTRPPTLPQLGDDLDTVLKETAATGRVVLVGHSMGGMVILAFAARHPETVQRVAGVALIATAADQLDSCGVGRALRTPIVPLLHLAARTSPWLAGRVWALARNGLAPLLGVPVTTCPALQANQHCCRMIGETSIATIVALLMAFRGHDQRRGLAALAHLPAAVACGEYDHITPMRHSESLAAALPHADLLRVPRAGHMLELERPGLVSSALIRLISRVRSCSMAPMVPA